MPAVAFVTIWWLLGFNVLLFIAGLRNISTEIYEAAGLDGAGRWDQFTRITWPLIWPVTVLVFTIQLILQLKIFDQVYLFANGGRLDATMVMVQYIFREAFQLNKGGLAAAAAVVLFVLIVGSVGAAVSAAAGARRAMSASVETAPISSRRQPPAGSPGCASLDLVGLVITLAPWSAPSCGRSRSIGDW